MTGSTPLERGFDGGRHVVTLRVAGWLRAIPAAFLALWLCGWAAGEAFAAGALLYTVGSLLWPGLEAPFGLRLAAGPPVLTWGAIGFLGLWLALWTLGGIAAAGSLLELLFLRERLLFDGGGIRLERRAGFLARVREWSAAEIEDVTLSRPSRQLELRARGRRHRLLALGTPAERAALRDELRSLFGRRATAADGTLPAGWEALAEPDGTVLTRDRAVRRRQAAVAWTIAALLAGGALAAALLLPPGAGSGALAAVLAVLAAPAAAGASWLGWGARDFVFRGDELVDRWRFGPRAWARTLRPSRVAVTRTVDSDGDEHFAVEVSEGAARWPLHSQMNDPDPARRLGRWVAARLGRELELNPSVADD